VEKVLACSAIVCFVQNLQRCYSVREPVAFIVSISALCKSIRSSEDFSWKRIAESAFAGVQICFQLFVNDCFIFNVFFVREMISFTENLSTPVWQGYFFAACMYIVAVIQAIMLQQYLHRCQLVGMQIRTVIISVIYEKVRCSNRICLLLQWYNEVLLKSSRMKFFNVFRRAKKHAQKKL